MLAHKLLSNKPIFIVGCPRSGTTLLQALLSTQSSICSFRETHYFTKIKPALIVDSDGYIEEGCLGTVYEMLHSILQLDLVKQERFNITTLTKEHKLTPKMLFEIIVALMIEKQTHCVAKNAIWLEKTPDHAFHLKEIYEWYPSARVIHILRHPIPVIYSMTNKFAFLKNKSIRELSKRWLMTIEAVESYSDRYSILTVKYEDLVSDVDKTIENICDYLKIDFNRDSLSQYAAKAKVITASSEVWKSDVQTPILSNTNLVALKKCSLLSKLVIYVITRHESVKYDYFNNMPLVNSGYFLWMSVVPNRLRAVINNLLAGR